MGFQFLFFLVVLIAIAAILRGDFAFTILYLIAGAYLFSFLWNLYSIRKLRVRRTFETHAFLGEVLPVRLQIRNTGLLPVLWMRFRESIPIALSTSKKLDEVVSLQPKGRAEVVYNLRARKRGRYALGPFRATSNDPLGLTDGYQIEGAPEDLIVYPAIIPLTRVPLPSRSPLGSLPHTQPIFEDPARVLSKRDYTVGDSLRRVDWKATAASGCLQVKQFEPSIALETILMLNLNSDEYPTQQRIDATELGIVIAASLANWIISKRQSVGFVTNGRDPAVSLTAPGRISPRKGRAHLMRILEELACVRLAEGLAFPDLVRQQGSDLPWGTTLILITGQADAALFEAVFQCRRRGQQVVLILAGRGTNLQESRRRAAYFGIPLHAFLTERDLDIWRQ